MAQNGGKQPKEHGQNRKWFWGQEPEISEVVQKGKGQDMSEPKVWGYEEFFLRAYS